MTIRRRNTNAVTLSGTVDVDLDHTTDSITIGDETNKLVLIDSGGTKTIPVKIYGAIAGGAAIVDDAAFTIGVDTVTPIGAVYKSSVDTLDDGDAGAVHMTSTRAMHVYIKGTDVGGSGGTSSIDSAAYTPATSSFTPMGGAFDDAATDSLAEGEMGIVRLTALRKMMVYDSACEALLTTQAGYLDGIEALLTSANGYQDGIETLITSTNTKLDTIITHVDGLEALIGTTNTNTGNIVTSVQLLDDVIVADNAGFTDGTTKLSMMGYIYDEVAGTVITENDAVAARVNLNRAQIHLIEDGVTRGRWATVSAANALKVDNSGVTQPVSGTFWQATQPISGTVTINAIPAGANNIGDVDVLSVVAAASTNKADIGLINAVTPLMGNGTTGTGSLRVTLASDNTANSNPWLVVGNIAHDTGVSGAPVRVAGRAQLANGTSVAEDDVCDMAVDNQGRVVTCAAPRALVLHQTTTITSSAAETTIVTAVASIFCDLTSIVITNSSTTGALVTIKDATAGTTRMIVYVPATGGIVINPHVPINQAVVNGNWTATCTSVASLYFYVQSVQRVA